MDFKKVKSSKGMHNVTIVRGLPGSGKTSYAQTFWPGVLLIEGDQYYMTGNGQYLFGTGMLKSSTEYTKVMLSTALSLDIKCVVITLTSPDGSSAKSLAKIARAFGYQVIHRWIDFDNGNTNQNRHRVPKEVIDSMKQDWKTIPGERVILRESRSEPRKNKYLFSFNPKHDMQNRYLVLPVGQYPDWFTKKLKKSKREHHELD